MPESAGKTLKRIRESKHLSLEEVSERSRIPKNIVSSIEEDRLNEIKSSFYAKSFVKTYAGFLGAMDEPAIKEYLAKGAQKAQKNPEAIAKPAATPLPEAKREKAPPAYVTPKIDFSIVTQYKYQIAAVIVGITVFWVLSAAIGEAGKFIKNSQARRQNKPVKSAIEHQSPERKPSVSYGAGISAPVKEKKEEVAPVKTDVIELEVFASGDTWLRVVSDGELMFIGSFRKGSKDTWKAKKEIKLETGNSGVIKINVNGKPADFSGKKGEKKEIVITKDGIK